MKYDEMSKAQIAKIMEKCLNCLYAEHCCDAVKDFYCDDFKDKNEYQKVVHAKWEFLNNDFRICSYEPMWEYMRCSSCGKTFYIRGNRKYCNNCGAKMDLE